MIDIGKTKWNIESVRNYVLNNSDCVLLSSKYQNNTQELDFICSCGNFFKRTWQSFLKTKKKCEECKGHFSWNTKKVEDYVVKNSDCKLLSKEYSGSKNLVFECKCGVVFKTKWAYFVHSNKRQCNKCSFSTKVTVAEVKRFIASNSTSKLMSNTYDGVHSTITLQCECGAIFNTTLDNFKRHNKTRCNECVGFTLWNIDKIREYVLVNSRCELLSGVYEHNHGVLDFKCECGNTFSTRWSDFTHANKRRCNTCTGKISDGEKRVLSYLENRKISNNTEHSFSDCIDNHPLRFDFFLPDYNILIEYDGIQHFESIEFFGGEEQLKIQQYRDNIKNQYCEDNNIPLLRIPYWEFDNTETILQEFLTEHGVLGEEANDCKTKLA